MKLIHKHYRRPDRIISEDTEIILSLWYNYLLSAKRWEKVAKRYMINYTKYGIYIIEDTTDDEEIELRKMFFEIFWHQSRF